MARFDLVRWATASAVLSADVSRPYISLMALQLPPGDLFFVGLRSLIVKYRGRSTEVAARPSVFSDALLDWGLNEFGRGFVDHLIDWTESVFQYSGIDGVSVFLWSGVVGDRTAREAPEFVNLLRQVRDQDPAPRILRQQPITEWDKELYARQAYDEMMNPLEWVQGTVNYVAFVRAWRTAVMRSYTGIDWEEVARWGKVRAAHLGMPLDQMGPPGSWPPLPEPWREQDEGER